MKLSLSNLFYWVNLEDVYNNLLATFIWVVTAGVLGFIFRARIANFLRKIIPQIDSSIPHVDFSIDYNARGDYKTDIKISNQGGEPAYNVNIFLYSRSCVDKNSYSVWPLAESAAHKGVLGVGNKEIIKNVELLFVEGGITAINEVWVEYDNALGVHFRTIVNPTSPRGDNPIVNPPKVIKIKLENVPGYMLSGNDRKWKKLEKGKLPLFPRVGILQRIRYSVKETWASIKLKIARKTKK